MDDRIKNSLAALTKSYAEQLPNKINELDILWQNYLSNKQAQQLDALRRGAHTLCGTAGTYGYKLISDVARKIEYSVDAVDFITADNQTVIDDLVQDLKQLALNLTVENINELNLELNDAARLEEDIYILSEAANTELRALNQFPFPVTIFATTDEFNQAIKSHTPGLIIMDVKYIDKIPPATFVTLKKDLIYIIFISDRDELDVRLLTIRHGGQAFLIRPVDLNAIVKIIENLFEAKKIKNDRILIMDDSEFISDYYAEIFKLSGMLTEKVSQPQYFLSTLQEFQPDLILMDINMPFCTGIELAQIVQQQENLNGIPIIFLSAISEKNKQLEVLSYAGDDFLTKPVNPKHLLAVVRNRLMRSKLVRTRMMRDSLTNLYNHTMIHHQLERELLIAERYNSELCVALIDIDHFKKINDTYGHQGGDIILKGLSGFLKNNLRKTDLVGRYGGEEFLIVLPNTDLDNAFAIIDQMRQKFSLVLHRTAEKEVYVTLSGGVANFPSYRSVSQLIKAADEVLYKAKDLGRNQIQLASTISS